MIFFVSFVPSFVSFVAPLLCSQGGTKDTKEGTKGNFAYPIFTKFLRNSDPSQKFPLYNK
jgi:hypothetical protein